MNLIRDAISRLLQVVMYWWVRVGDNLHHTDFERLKQARKHGQQVIYVLEHRSLADKLVLDRECKKHGLPPVLERLQNHGLEGRQPLIAVREHTNLLGSVKNELDEDIQALLDFLKQYPQQDVLLVPVALYWGRAAENNTNPIKALLSSNWTVVGRFKKLLTVLINGRNTYFEINDPLSLRDLLAKQQSIKESRANVIKKLSRLLKVHFRRVRSAVIGPDMSHRRLLVGKVMTSDYVQSVIQEHAQEHGISVTDARKQAQKNIDAIAADLSNNKVRFLSAIMSWVWNKIYQGIEMQGIEPVRELARDSVLVFAPCHRSHIDYLLLSYQLYHNGLNVPHIVAGENLNMPVVGRILRGCGAFFIRRSFAGDKLYTAVFNEYLHNIFTSGFSVEYFVEGGRSRTGRMLKPATGTLAMTVRSHLRDNKKPVVIVPVYIGYEKVFESGSYQGELRGKTKKKENLFDLAKTVNKLKNNGQVYLNFGEAIHLNEHLDQQHPSWRDQDYAPDAKPEWLPEVVNDLSLQLAARINNTAAINPINLVATALLATPRHSIDGALLEKHLTLLVDMQESQPYSAELSLPKGTPQQWIDYACSMEYLSHIPQSLGDIYGLNSKSVVAISYYRNNIQHLYALPALIAALVTQGDGVSLKAIQRGIRQVYPHIQNELFLSVSLDDALAKVDAWLAFFETHGLVTREADHWLAPEKDKATHLQLELLSNIMLPALERYFIGLSLLVRQGSGQCTAQELELQSQQMAQRLSLLNGLDAPEFFDKTLFRRFIESLERGGVIRVNSEGMIEFNKTLIADLQSADQVLPAEVVYNVLQVSDLP